MRNWFPSAALVVLSLVVGNLQAQTSNGCATLCSFDNTSLSGFAAGWTNATQTATASNLVVAASGASHFGDSFKEVTPIVSTFSNLTLRLDCTIGNLNGGVIGPIVVLDDGAGNQLRYAFYHQNAGNHVLTVPLKKGVQALGKGFNFSNIEFVHLQVDPEGVTGDYKITFNDLSVTGCGGAQ